MPATRPEAAALREHLRKTAAAPTRRPWSTAADGAGVSRRGGAGRAALSAGRVRGAGVLGSGPTAGER